MVKRVMVHCTQAVNFTESVSDEAGVSLLSASGGVLSLTLSRAVSLNCVSDKVELPVNFPKPYA